MGNRVAFILASTLNGPMILNRLDYAPAGEGYVGVGAGLLGIGSHEQNDIEQLFGLLQARRDQHRCPMFVIDGGANIGTHTIAWARGMEGWGQVIAFEPQERTFYALAGNIALNNCFNATAKLAALGKLTDTISVPQFDQTVPNNFGGMSLPRGDGASLSSREVALVAIDDLGLTRLDLLKLDVEGMETDAIDGAQQTIKRCKPLIFVEVATCGKEAVERRLPEYRLLPCALSMLGIHREDPILKHIRINEEAA